MIFLAHLKPHLHSSADREVIRGAELMSQDSPGNIWIECFWFPKWTHVTSWPRGLARLWIPLGILKGTREPIVSYSSFFSISSLACLEKEMATHSSILAWRIPGTAEPGGLPSKGSHGVGHDWSDLAAGPPPALSLHTYAKWTDRVQKLWLICLKTPVRWFP